ncbi:8-amino-7-oxononanoate synthase [Xanthomonadaceae bacterium XH05]|nr:8-amino-7-oxononanoate synthase [Xanthomonadaceae bacterium XH05]
MSAGPRERVVRPGLLSRLAVERAARARAGLERRSREIGAREGIAIEVDGQVLRNFCSNDYLGLSQHSEVVAALQECAAWRGVGAGASHLVCGHYREHRELEEAIAEWQGYPRALLFSSGYLANLAVVQTLLREGDLCVQDKLNHASLIDAARLAGAELKRYPHALPDGALRQLRSQPAAAALLATDGVFSMDGDIAPLKILAVLARAENATFYVDDAHGAGVLGPDGCGSVAHSGLSVNEVPLQLITLGKALGGAGAVLVGQAALIEAIADSARPYIYTTALPPALAAAARSALAIARREPWRRFKLAGLVARFRRGAQQIGVGLMDSSTPIQPIVIGSNTAALAAARQLEKAGFFVGAIRPPTVPEGRARLRVTLNALHSEADVDALLDALAGVARRLAGE